MTRPVRRAAFFALALGLSACGDHLGTYKLEDVRVVQQLPQRNTPDWPAYPYSQYLRIELSSEFNLNTANTGPGLYTDADFCPLRDPNRLIAFGPVANDELPVESWKRQQRLAPDRRDGRYHYFVYVVPSSSQRKLFTNSTDQIPAYDLRHDQRPICIRFFVPGYNIIKSRSDAVEIPAQSIARALSSSSVMARP